MERENLEELQTDVNGYMLTEIIYRSRNLALET
jgi:hypothetical protein